MPCFDGTIPEGQIPDFDPEKENPKPVISEKPNHQPCGIVRGTLLDGQLGQISGNRLGIDTYRQSVDNLIGANVLH